MPFLTHFSLPADMAQFLGPSGAFLMSKRPACHPNAKGQAEKQQQQQQQRRKKSVKVKNQAQARKVKEDLGVAVERGVELFHCSVFSMKHLMQGSEMLSYRTFVWLIHSIYLWLTYYLFLFFRCGSWYWHEAFSQGFQELYRGVWANQSKYLLILLLFTKYVSANKVSSPNPVVYWLHCFYVPKGKSFPWETQKADKKQKFKKQVREATSFTDMVTHLEEMIQWCKRQKMEKEKHLLTFLRLKCQRMKGLEAAGYK